VWQQASIQLCKKPLYRKLKTENEKLGFIRSFEAVCRRIERVVCLWFDDIWCEEAISVGRVYIES